MKTLINCCIFIALFPILVAAQIEVNAPISSVTIYSPEGIKIVRTIDVTIAEGQQQLLLKDIEYKILPSSLSVTFDNPNAVLLEVAAPINYIQQPIDNEAVASQKIDLKVAEDSLVMVNNFLSILFQEATILKDNQLLKDLEPTEVAVLANQYRTRMLELKAIEAQQNKLKKDLEARINRLKLSIRQSNANTERVRNIEIKLLGNRRTNLKIKLSYLVENSFWKPIYDIRSMGMNKALAVNYRAAISNQTGKDWTAVPITLSTAKPTLNQDVPRISTVFARPAQLYYVDTITTFDPETYEEPIQTVKSERDDLVGGNDDVYFNKSMLHNSPINFSYTLSNLHDIKTQDGWYYVAIKELELEAEYEYFAIPKSNHEVFLLARMTDYGKHHLVPGDANIFFENTYIGQTFLDTKSVADTLELSLGIAQGVQVDWSERDFTKAKLIGNSKRQTFSYEIVVRNNLQTTIPIRIQDHVPISTDNRIEVELEKKDKAAYNANTGILTWQLNIPPNTSKTLDFVYQMKYPKEQPIEIGN